jgi:hypothetical protein
MAYQCFHASKIIIITALLYTQLFNYHSRIARIIGDCPPPLISATPDQYTKRPITHTGFVFSIGRRGVSGNV